MKRINSRGETVKLKKKIYTLKYISLVISYDATVGASWIM